MSSNSVINKVFDYAKLSPVLAVGLPAEIFEGALVLDSNIDSSKLGIVNTEKGLNYPDWYVAIAKRRGLRQIVISDIDKISKEEQEKFYEMLKYKQISGVDLPENTEIIVLAKNIKNVSETIIRLCAIIN